MLSRVLFSLLFVVTGTLYSAAPDAGPIVAGILSLETEQSSAFLRIVYVRTIEQYPEFQRHVFKDSPSMLERLNQKKRPKVTSTDYIRIVANGKKAAHGRIRTSDSDGPEYAGLVQAVVNDDTRSRLWLYKSGPLSTVAVSMGKPVLDLKREKLSPTVLPEERPWGAVIQALNTTCENFGVEFRSAAQAKPPVAASPQLVFEVENSEWKHVLAFGNVYGISVPERIVSANRDASMRDETTVSYMPLRISAVDRPFPQRTRTSRYVKVDGQYCLYLRVALDVLEAVALRPDQDVQAIDISSSPALLPGEINALINLRAQYAPY